MAFNLGKITGTENMLQEQLYVHHLEDLNSLCNSSTIAIKKKSGEQRIITDFKATNKVILPKDSLHSGISLSYLICEGWFIVVIDLNICLFTILLQREQRKICLECPLKIISSPKVPLENSSIRNVKQPHLVSIFCISIRAKQ